MTTNQAYCNGFISECSMQECEAGSVRFTRASKKYIPGTSCSLVERYSGGKLGLAFSNVNIGTTNMCLNLSRQNDLFVSTYNGNQTTFTFNITFRIYNVKKTIVNNKVQYNVIKNLDELYVGPDNLVAILLEWQRSDGFLISTWMSYSTNQVPRIQEWDGTVGVTNALSTDVLTDPNLLWYAYRQNNRTSPCAILSGEYLAFQSYGRVQSMALNPLDLYVGGIMQKDNTSSFTPQSCLNITEQDTIAFMITGQNNLAQQSIKGFARGNIDYCSEADCGNCSLAFFQIATVNGCIQGSESLNSAQILTIFIALLAVVFIIYLLILTRFN